MGREKVGGGVVFSNCKKKKRQVLRHEMVQDS